MRELMEFENSGNLAHRYFRTPPRIMKAVTQLLVSVYLFYCIFFHASSSRSYFLFHSLKFYLSAIPSHSLDKRWIFLICNGILAIIANTSGLVSFTSGKRDRNEHQLPHDHHLHAPAAVDRPVLFLVEQVPVLLLESAEESGNAKSENRQSEDLLETSEEEDHEEEEGDNSSIIMEDHEEKLEPAAGEGESGGEEIRIDITEDDDYDEANENYSGDGFDPWEEHVQSTVQEDEEGLMLEKLSAEELNKKFDDFIRKMKEDLRIEAQQQHLVVVK